MFGARAIAETLFGDNNPSGKLPYTYYRANYTQRLSIDEYAMAKPPGRGYRYMDPDDRDILLPFGHGLSYTTFRAGWPTLKYELDNALDSSSVSLGLKVTNTGSARGAETLLAYWAPLNRTNPGGAGLLPLQRRLFGFAKTHELAPGASQLLNISLSVEGLSMADADGSLVSFPGAYRLIVSRGTPDSELEAALQLSGSRRVLETLPPGL